MTEPRPADRPALRETIRLAIARHHLKEFGSDRTVEDLDAAEFGADAVMAVLPAPADRASVLREAADRLDRLGLRDLATRELRRMAAEAETGGAR
ncbi:hypothetical protein ACWEP3_25160 [Streptomyces albidoflavus]